MASDDDSKKPVKPTPPGRSPEDRARRLRNMARGYELYLKKGDQGISEHLDRLEMERAGVQDFSSDEFPDS